MKRVIAGLLVSLCLGAAGESLATTYPYVATLDGLQETPPNASPASGTAYLVHDDVANTLTMSISFSGLIGTLSASHIHGPGAPGTPAGVVYGIPSTPIGSTSGTYGSVWSALTATQIGYLTGSLLYFNLHSSAFPGGEIRGQIVPEAPTPAPAVSWGKLKSFYR